MTLTATATFKTTHRYGVSDETFLRCLEALRQGVADYRQHEKRGAERLDFYGNPVVACTRPAASGEQPELLSFRVWGRDLSRGGVSFICGTKLLPVGEGDQPSELEIMRLLRPNEEISVGLGRPDGEIMWLVARVVRMHPVQDDLLEGSVHFLRRRDPIQES
ncbi:MAG: hypothetical protein AB7O62_00735 [Pirellulales bacterium]